MKDNKSITCFEYTDEFKQETKVRKTFGQDAIIDNTQLDFHANVLIK